MYLFIKARILTLLLVLIYCIESRSVFFQCKNTDRETNSGLSNLKFGNQKYSQISNTFATCTNHKYNSGFLPSKTHRAYTCGSGFLYLRELSPKLATVCATQDLLKQLQTTPDDLFYMKVDDDQIIFRIKDKAGANTESEVAMSDLYAKYACKKRFSPAGFVGTLKKLKEALEDIKSGCDCNQNIRNRLTDIMTNMLNKLSERDEQCKKVDIIKQEDAANAAVKTAIWKLLLTGVADFVPGGGILGKIYDVVEKVLNSDAMDKLSKIYDVFSQVEDLSDAVQKVDKLTTTKDDIDKSTKVHRNIGNLFKVTTSLCDALMNQNDISKKNAECGGISPNLGTNDAKEGVVNKIRFKRQYMN